MALCTRLAQAGDSGLFCQAFSLVATGLFSNDVAETPAASRLHCPC